MPDAQGQHGPFRAIARHARHAALLMLAVVIAGCSAGFSGKYEEVDGAGCMEFKSDGTVYIEVMGMTSQAQYDVDGDKVIIRTPQGSQVFTREGDTLNGGDGILSATFKLSS